MNNTEPIKLLLTDIESDHVERTISTTNTDKIGQKRTKTDKNGQPIVKETNVFPSAFIKTVYETIKSNPKAKYSWLEDNLGVNERTIRRAVEELKKLGYINPEHSKMGGEWQLLK